MADQKLPVLKPLPVNFANVPGVSFTRPPDALILDVSRVINDALKTLEPGKTTAIVTVITDKGANAALVAKFNDTWSVAGFLGKEWGRQGGGRGLHPRVVVIAKDWGSRVQGGAMVRYTW